MHFFFTLQVETGNETLEHKFLGFVKNLLEDQDGREHFLKVNLCSVLILSFGIVRRNDVSRLICMCISQKSFCPGVQMGSVLMTLWQPFYLIHYGALF